MQCPRRLWEVAPLPVTRLVSQPTTHCSAGVQHQLNFTELDLAYCVPPTEQALEKKISGGLSKNAVGFVSTSLVLQQSCKVTSIKCFHSAWVLGSTHISIQCEPLALTGVACRCFSNWSHYHFEVYLSRCLLPQIIMIDHLLCYRLTSHSCLSSFTNTRQVVFILMTLTPHLSDSASQHWQWLSETPC